MPWQAKGSWPLTSPWDDPPVPAPAVVRVRWDYLAQQVVDDAMCSIFDTTWTYCYDGITVTGWWVLKDPWSGPQYLLEAEVPEMVRLAVMVS